MPKQVTIGDNKFASISYYRRKPFINIREYIISQDGTFVPTKNGILLTPHEWIKLKSVVQDIDHTVAEHIATPTKAATVTAATQTVDPDSGVESGTESSNIVTPTASPTNATIQQTLHAEIQHPKKARKRLKLDCEQNFNQV